MSAAEVLKRAVESTPARELPLKSVQIDGQVILKVMAHCSSSSAAAAAAGHGSQSQQQQLATGQLLGLDVGQTLEVTDCFAFPASFADADASAAAGGPSSANASSAAADADASGQYQLEVMRCLREANADNNTVGWYQSAPLGAYQTAEMVETFVNFHESLRSKCVCLVYDADRAARGGFGLKAVRVKAPLMAAFRAGKLSGRELREAGISWRDVFQEVPLKVHNSSLAQALIADACLSARGGSSAGGGGGATAADLERLSLTQPAFVERATGALVECVDELLGEQAKVAAYHRSVARQAQQAAAWLQRRRHENAARRAAGEEPLPEEDATLFAPIPEPSSLEHHLIVNQIASYCDQLEEASAALTAKLAAAKACSNA